MTIPQVNLPFWRSVDFLAGPGGCWHWQGCLSSDGYGKSSIVLPDGRRYYAHAHRIAYLRERGPIPTGLQVDHTCHTKDKSCVGGKTCLHRRCVNPYHLEAVSQQENLARSRGNALKGHCKYGHSFTPDNIRVTSVGTRRCRKCTNEQSLAAYYAKKAAA